MDCLHPGDLCGCLDSLSPMVSHPPLRLWRVIFSGLQALSPFSNILVPFPEFVPLSQFSRFLANALVSFEWLAFLSQ